MRIDIRKLNADDIKWIIKIFIIWNSIHILFEVIGALTMKIISDYSELYSFNFSDSLYRLSFHALSFTIGLVISYYLTHKKIFSLYSFVSLQTFIFHVIYLNNLNKDDDGILRIYTNWNDGIMYFINNWPGILDIVNNYWPLEGSFDDGMFIPGNTEYFYLLWIVLPLTYYFLITYITDIIENRKLISRMRKADFSIL